VTKFRTLLEAATVTQPIARHGDIRCCLKPIFGGSLAGPVARGRVRTRAFAPDDLLST